jgi:hypothetical protein
MMHLGMTGRDKALPERNREGDVHDPTHVHMADLGRAQPELHASKAARVPRDASPVPHLSNQHLDFSGHHCLASRCE